MRKLCLPLVLALLWACGPAPPTPADGGAQDGGAEDLAEPAPDLALGPIRSGALGAACSTVMDCGKVPKDAVCFREYLLNSPVLQRTPGGYCSAYCDRDADCGADGRCVDLVFAGKACFARCDKSGICRAGYACLIADGICAPAGNLNCDPTVDGGRCMAQVDIDSSKPKVPGGCLREAFENLGRCAPACNIATASCPIDPLERTTQHCVYLDTTVRLDLKPTQDLWKGLVCVHDTLPAALDGQACTSFEGCLEGSQCDLWPGGSSRCYPLCVQGGSPSCKAGTTCQDQLRGGTAQGSVGLCK